MNARRLVPYFLFAFLLYSFGIQAHERLQCLLVDGGNQYTEFRAGDVQVVNLIQDQKNQYFKYKVVHKSLRGDNTPFRLEYSNLNGEVRFDIATFEKRESNGRLIAHYRGYELFRFMMNHLQSSGHPIQTIKGIWNLGSTNYFTYKEARNNGKTPEEAARLTFTGRQAIEMGFTKITVQADIGSSVINPIQVTFEKPLAPY